MPFLEIKFSGSCAFVINDDREVDVYFLNPAPLGHAHDSSHLHVPILTSSSGTIASTNADGLSAGRSSGLPLYLARWKTSRFSVDALERSGPVAFSAAADATVKPQSPADWQDLAYCLDLEVLQPAAAIDAARARGNAIHVMSLRGGELKGTIPSQQLGDAPWHAGGAAPGTPGTFVTDTIVYRFEYPSGTVALTLSHPQRGDRQIRFTRDSDVRLTVVHEPFLITLDDAAPAADLSHLGAVFEAFTGASLPPNAVLRQPPPATPDPTYCPPGRVRDRR